MTGTAQGRCRVAQRRLPLRHRAWPAIVGALLAIPLLLLVLPARAQTAAGDAPLLTAQADAIPDQYIVVLRQDRVAAAAVSIKVAGAKQLVGTRVLHQYGSVLRGFAAVLSPVGLAALRKDPDVAYIAQDRRMSIDVTQTNPPWGLDRIDQRALPLSNGYSYGNDGTGVHAYIIDTGIRASHGEFAGRIGTGRDLVDGDNDPDDCQGHGTHVAGTVGGSTYGVAKGVTLHGVRVLDCSGSGSTAGVIAGIEWVTNNHESPAVANMSLGGSAWQPLDDAVAASVAAGVTHVVAAGNSDTDACSSSPARASSAITVGATGSSDMRASFSNYGTCLDIFAPGVGVLSAYHTSDSATASLSGTSMASPHVAGVVAIYLQGAPGATPAQVTSALLNAATSGVVSDPQSGSPNRLLYTPLATPGTPTPTVTGTPPTATPTATPTRTPTRTPTPTAPLFDAIGGAKGIASASYGDTADTSAATIASDDPVASCHWRQGGGSVWYRFTTTGGAASIATAGSAYDTVLSLYRGAPGALTPIACNDDVAVSVGDLTSAVSASLSAGTYYIMVTNYWPTAGSELVLSASLGGVVGATATPTHTTEPTRTSAPTSTPTPLPTAVVTPAPAPPPMVSGIDPASGADGAITNVQIRGSGFLGAPTASLVDADGGRTALGAVSRVSATQLLAQVPAGMDSDVYSVEVCNPDDQCAILPQAFTIADGGPRLLAVAPSQGSTSAPVLVTLYGFDFQPGVSATVGATALTSVRRVSATLATGYLPAGVAAGTYDITVRNSASGPASTLPNAYTAYDPATDDLAAENDDLTTNPSTVRAGAMTLLQLNVWRRGTGTAALSVPVAFYRRTSSGSLLEIGRTTSASIAPGTLTPTLVSTSWDTSGLAGDVTIVAIIDPDLTLGELVTSNNTAQRTITVMPLAAGDQIAPMVDAVRLDDGASEVRDGTVTVALTARDNEGGSGLAGMFLIERVFDAGSLTWAVTQQTGWVPYRPTYSLTLAGDAGLHYIQVWVSDVAGNVSARPARAAVNVTPDAATLRGSQVHVFRQTLAVGERLSATVATASGDADLYVWDPEGKLAGSSVRTGTQTDAVSLTATLAGVYQIEVYGYAASAYRLTIDGSGIVAEVPPELGITKTVRSAPAVAPAAVPASTTGVPVAPQFTFTLYTPVLRR